MNQPKPERGTKRTCQSCDAHFYDLARAHPLCPKCGTEFVEIVLPASTYRSRRKAGSGSLSGRPFEAEQGGDATIDKSLPIDEERDPDDEDEEGKEAEGEDADE